MRLNRSFIALCASIGFLCPSATTAAASCYTSEADFNAAAAGYGTRTVESFESEPGVASTDTSLDCAPLTFSCVGSTWCPGFFGRDTLYSTDGTRSVRDSTPDAMVFTFDAPIKVFAVDLIGLGDVGTTTFIALLSNGDGAVLFADLSQPGGSENFVGVIDDTGFTSITFSGRQANDGVYHDRAQHVGAVPEPSTCVLMALGHVGLVAARRRCA